MIVVKVAQNCLDFSSNFPKVALSDPKLRRLWVPEYMPDCDPAKLLKADGRELFT